MMVHVGGGPGPSSPDRSAARSFTSWAALALVAAAALAPRPVAAQDDQTTTPGAATTAPADDLSAPADLGPQNDLSAPLDEGSGESSAGAPASPAATGNNAAQADFTLRLQQMEDAVNQLKEEIFRSKSRLVLLRERVLGTAVGGSQAVISHVNDMSATFNLAQVIYSLDGNQIYSAVDDHGSLADRDRFEIYNGAIVSGPHNLAVEMTFVGNGFGVFSYLEGYRFRVRSSYAFNAEDGKTVHLDVVAYEQGGVNQPIEERPDIRYQMELTDTTPNVAEQ